MNLVALWGLFASAFMAATIFPAQSELVLGGILASGAEPVWLFIMVATAGNTLGAAVNWLLGRFFNRFKGCKWFPVKENALLKAEQWYHKYGRWSLLLSWIPVIGDPLTLAAGLLREPFAFFICIVAFAKFARYLVVAMITFYWVV